MVEKAGEVAVAVNNLMTTNNQNKILCDIGVLCLSAEASAQADS